MPAELTQSRLDQVAAELMKHAAPPMVCPQCKRPIFVIGLREGQTKPDGPCLECLASQQPQEGA